MNRAILIVLIILTTQVVFNSCKTSKYQAASINSSEVKDIQAFQTLSYIELVDWQNVGILDSGLSYNSMLLAEECMAQLNQLPITGRISVSFSDTQQYFQYRVRSEIINLCKACYETPKRNEIKLPPLIDSLLEASGKRFGLITVTHGFTRKPQNYTSKEMTKRVFFGPDLHELKKFVYQKYGIHEFKANSGIFNIIVDAKNNNITYYRLETWEGQEPLNKQILMHQIKRAFGGYFWPKPSLDFIPQR